jgi:bifunctional enzyme Fae/Hps
MDLKLDRRSRYLQLAFNYDLGMVRQVLPNIPVHERILIEAGTPFIKNEGMDGVRYIRRIWRGTLVADMKVIDGALGEVMMARNAGANAVTAIGNAPQETLNLFVETCNDLNMISMIDLLGVDDPLDTMRKLKVRPDVMVLHRGRDEENTMGKVIQYRHVRRIRIKYDVNISAAGGVGLKEAGSAIFNGANIVVVNLVRPGDGWEGISIDSDVTGLVHQFLTTIE